jgi:DNA modification methylase
MDRWLLGDTRERLRDLDAGSVHACVTSPPYWGLRDYGVDGQIGMEPTFPEYVDTLVDVFREVKRALRDDGTLWLNLGDCYATGAGKVGEHPGGGEQGARWKGETSRSAERSGHEGKHAYRVGPLTQPNRLPQPGLKPKDLVGLPWRAAFALQADGWWLRSGIVWEKPNPMPESVQDRPTTAHEMVFLLAKSEAYFYDIDAIREPHTMKPQRRAAPPGQPRGQIGRSNGGLEAFVRDEVGVDGHVGGRNARTVWTIPTRPFSEAHFATMPPDLAERCVLAGSSGGGRLFQVRNPAHA